MSDKLCYTAGTKPASQIGDTLECLAKTIDARKDADETSYTYRLLTGRLDTLLKKLVEEAHEVSLAAKDFEAQPTDDATLDHLRYEMGDVMYHLMVLLARFNISLDEFAAELNSRMTADELSARSGIALIDPAHINRAHDEGEA